MHKFSDKDTKNSFQGKSKTTAALLVYHFYIYLQTWKIKQIKNGAITLGLEKTPAH